MVHVTKIQNWNFDIPESCSKCPMCYSERGEGFSIYYCLLKKDKEFPYNTVKYKKSPKYNKCPAKDGETYTI